MAVVGPPRRRTALVQCLAVAILAGGCLGDVLGPPVAFHLAPRDTAVYPGHAFRLRAVLVDQRGDERSNDRVSYQTPDPSMLQISPSGDVMPLAEGRARVVVQGSNVNDTAWVSVVPAAMLAIGNRLGEHPTVIVISNDGTSRTTVADVAGSLVESEPAWAPAGDVIAFQAGSPSTLYLTDSTALVRAVPIGGTPVDRLHPRFSHDGAWIYFVQGGGIWRVHPDGTGAASLGISGNRPDPSPDGVSLLFTGTVSAEPAIDIVAVSGGTPTPVATRAIVGRWSHAGDWIAYVSSVQGAVWVVRRDGTGQRPVSVPGRHYRPQSLDWSPDDAWIVAASDSTVDLIQVSSGATLPLAFARGSSAAWRP